MDLELPHRRYDPLSDQWVLVSPQRAKRPWQGAVETPAEELPSYDADCYLCPGNARAGGEVNPHYDSTFVFPNDFPAILPAGAGSLPAGGHPLFQVQPVSGVCQVICYSPDHSQRLSTLGRTALRAVVDLWVAQAQALESYRWVQVFENRGAAMGNSSPHPHGQIWAMDEVPTLVQREDRTQRAYFEQHRSRLLEAIVLAETGGPRVVTENEEWLWLVPFWAVWPFEILLLPRRPVARLQELDPAQREGLADIMAEGLPRYDALFGVPFPYSMGWHGAPNGQEAELWTLHAHFYPPLLRSATVRKFMVGFEMLAEAQRDMTPEQAAARLREQ